MGRPKKSSRPFEEYNHKERLPKADSHQFDMAVYKMARELIYSALRDLASTNQKYHIEAYRWFKDRSDSVCSYGWALSLSQLNPNRVRDAIEFNMNRRFDKPKRRKAA